MMEKVYFKRRIISNIVLAAVIAAMIALIPVKSFSETRVIPEGKRVMVAQDADSETATDGETEVIDAEDEELITIEDSLVPLSSNIEVEKAGHKMIGGWWVIILAIVCVAGITAYAHRE